MSYSLETKKRKFDRILESLTDGSSTTDSRPSLNTRSNAPSLRESLLEASKRRRLAAKSNITSSTTSLVHTYLPSSRAAFLERLETYKHVTKWHVPSTVAVNAVEWAKRGWVCSDVDTVLCHSCGERVVVDLNIDSTTQAEDEIAADKRSSPQTEEQSDGDDLAVEFYHSLLMRYQQMIITSHAESCSWRKRGCDSSIQRIEGLLSANSTVAATKSRASDIFNSIESIPTVSDLPSFEDTPPPALENICDEESQPDKYTNALRLAICGWLPKSDHPDVLSCNHCFRSLGLWLYRGKSPTVEHLDPIDSHLEYCPWRSPEAQDTLNVVRVSGTDQSGKSIKMPGWVLVCQALRKQTLKKAGLATESSLSLADVDGNGTSGEKQQLTPEQREKKMKDLMRRIKEIRKPFNVKGLLRKRDPPR